MATANWPDLIVASLGGGLTLKLLEIAYQELGKGRDRKSKSVAFLNEHIDPVLKTADELVGKIRSLAERDFKPLKAEANAFRDSEVAVVAYLFATFWARIEVLRRKSLYVELSRSKKGEQLLKFFDCLESQRVRVVGRARQRALGELLCEPGSEGDALTYVKFVSLYTTDDDVKAWFSPLVQVLSESHAPPVKQKLLLYGAVVHALIDTLDADHAVSRDRPAPSNKMTAKTRRSLRHRVFGVYLPFVKSPEKYSGSIKTIGPRALPSQGGSAVGPMLDVGRDKRA
jgi:hypothetical protein